MPQELDFRRFWQRLEDAGRAGHRNNELALLTSLVGGNSGSRGGTGSGRDILRELFDLDAARVANGKAMSALQASGLEIADDVDRLVRPYAEHCKRHGQGMTSELVR